MMHQTVNMKYTDFDGAEFEIEAVVSVELQTGIINEGLAWEEKKLVLRHQDKVVGRKGLCYREVKRN